MALESQSCLRLRAPEQPALELVTGIPSRHGLQLTPLSAVQEAKPSHRVRPLWLISTKACPVKQKRQPSLLLLKAALLASE